MALIYLKNYSTKSQGHLQTNKQHARRINRKLKKKNKQTEMTILEFRTRDTQHLEFKRHLI